MSRGVARRPPLGLFVPAAVAVLFIALPLGGLLTHVSWRDLPAEFASDDVQTAVRLSLECSLLAVAVGGAVGGVAGALVGLGIPKEEARYFDEGFRKGGMLVTVNAPNRAAEVVQIRPGRQCTGHIDSMHSLGPQSGRMK